MDREDGRGAGRRFSPELKLQAIREARQGRVPISRVCEKHGIRPGQFYQWEKKA